MNALVVGFPLDEMRRISQEVRAMGHHVLGAVGKQGAWTFLRAVAPDLVIVPQGLEGDRARGWVFDVAVEVPFVAVAIGGDAVDAVARFVRGEAPALPLALSLEDSAPPALPEVAPPLPPVAPLPLVRELPTTPATLAADSAGPTTRRKRRPGRDEDGSEDPEVRDPHPDLASKLAQVRFGDYHSILECEPQASPYAVREQRDRLMRRFSPRGWPGRLMPEELEMLNEISRGLVDAFLILSDSELVTRYERALSRTVGPTNGNDDSAFATSRRANPDALPRP